MPATSRGSEGPTESSPAGPAGNHGTAQHVRELATGIGFTEGPVWTRSGRLLVTSISRGLIYEVPLPGEQVAGEQARPVLEPGGGPNGMAEDAGGTLWIAQSGGTITPSRSERAVSPSVQRWSGGEVEDVLAEGLDAPNDCAVAPDGRLWFTDPRGSAAAERPAPGRLCAFSPDSGEFEVLRSGPLYPNGLAFGPDPDDFFLAETLARRVLRFRVVAGKLGEPEVFAELPAGEPDGMAFDADGNLYVAAPSADCVVVFDPAGRRVETIDLGGPAFPTNVCFGGPDGATLFVTAAKGGRVLAVERPVAGLPLLRSRG